MFEYDSKSQEITKVGEIGELVIDGGEAFLSLNDEEFDLSEINSKLAHGSYSIRDRVCMYGFAPEIVNKFLSLKKGRGEVKRDK